MRKLLSVFIFISLLGLGACKKDSKKTDPEPEPVVTGGTLKLYFEDKVDNEVMEFGKNYLNANGDTFKISKFSYYISNIVLTGNDNSTYAEAGSYHLLRHVSGSAGNYISVSNVPYGNYKSVRFMLGVDSARNVSGAQTGDLEPSRASDMYWSWNSGYIFIKLEGTSPKSMASDKSITFHIGGYGGVNKAQRSFNLEFNGTTANVSASATPTVKVRVNANEMFQTPNKISFAAKYDQTSAGAGAKLLADNYADMMGFNAVINQ